MPAPLFDTATLDDAHAAGLNGPVDVNSPNRLRVFREAFGSISIIRGSGKNAPTIELDDGELGEVLAILREELGRDQAQVRNAVWAVAS